MKRVVLFLNNWTGWQVARVVRASGVQIAALVIHPAERRRYADEIVSEAGLSPDRILEAAALGSPDTLERIRSLAPDLGVSANFGYILKRDLLDVFREGVVNLHAAYLPYNRGSAPVVWAIVEGTPAATLHWVDEGVDTGDIIARVQVPVELIDTAGTLYRRIETAAVELFAAEWPRVLDGTAARTPQTGPSTFHRYRDIERLASIDLDARYTARELIDRIRARTVPGQDGVYCEVGGRRVYMRLELYEAAR